MLAAGIKTPMTLDELESHLREDIRFYLADGRSEKEAFNLAVTRLGKPGLLRTEFNKVESRTWWPVTVGYWLYVGSMVSMAVSIAMSGRLLLGASKMGLIANPILLYVHIITVTAGYCAAFFGGFFGILCVCRQFFHAVSPNRHQVVERAILLFSQISAGFVSVGFVMGMLWYHQHSGRFFKGDLKEVGALCVVICLVALCWARRRRWMSERTTIQMSVVGNIVVSLAWFGAGIADRPPAGLWPLALCVLLGIHFVFLIMGLATSTKSES